MPSARRNSSSPTVPWWAPGLTSPVKVAAERSDALELAPSDRAAQLSEAAGVLGCELARMDAGRRRLGRGRGRRRGEHDDCDEHR